MLLVDAAQVTDLARSRKVSKLREAFKNGLSMITKILAIEKLLDYLASGIGATSRPALSPLAGIHGGACRNAFLPGLMLMLLAIIAQAQAAARQLLGRAETQMYKGR